MKKIWLILIMLCAAKGNIWAKTPDSPKRIEKNPQYQCQNKGDDVIYCLDADGRPLTGKWEKIGENGIKISIENFRKGYRNGLCTYFDKYGNYKERVYYKEGLKNGMDKIYFRNRTINILANYKDGLLDGRQDVYFDDGKLNGRFTYKNGELLRGMCADKKGSKTNLTNQQIKDSSYNSMYVCGE